MSDDFGGMNSTVSEELDFSADGIVKKEYTFTITEAEKEDRETPTGSAVQVKIVLETDGIAFPITVTAWLEHSNPKAVAAGRGQLKRIFAAALGQPKGAVEALVGKKVLATASEDAQGFARLAGFKPVPKAVEAVNLG